MMTLLVIILTDINSYDDIMMTLPKIPKLSKNQPKIVNIN